MLTAIDTVWQSVGMRDHHVDLLATMRKDYTFDLGLHHLDKCCIYNYKTDTRLRLADCDLQQQQYDPTAAENKLQNK